MRVLVNLLWLVPGVVGGSEGHATGLLRELARDGTVEVELAVLPGFAQAHPDLAASFPTLVAPGTGGRKVVRRVATEATWLSTQLRRRRPDVAHHLGGTLPPGSPGPSVVTVHDLQYRHYPQYFSRLKRTYLSAVTPMSLRRASVVATPSRFTRDDVISAFGLDPHRVVVTPAALPTSAPVPAEQVAQVAGKLGLAGRWVVYPAATYPHKNHATAVRAFATVARALPEVSLLLTGASGAGAWGSAASTLADLRALVAAENLQGRVVMPGYLPSQDYQAALAGASALVFPSEFEGYGLPVVEAMAAGVPVLAAATTALPELVDGADPGGLLLGVHDVAAWESALMQVLTDPAQAARWAAAGRRRVSELSDPAPVHRLLDAYRLAAGAR